MNQNETITRLKEPFTSKEIEWKLQTTVHDKTDKDKVRGLAVPYIDSRAIQKRLDEAVGSFNWRNEYCMWQEKSQICGISLYNDERGEWVTKFDGAENSDYEPIKGGLSDAFKRTAVLWGIGRYLYELDGVWVDVEPKGKSYAIKKDQYATLEAAYNAMVAKLFDTTMPPKQNGTSAAPANPAPTPAPHEPPLPDAPPPMSQTPQPPTPDVYRVHSAKASGKQSLLLELIDSGSGELINAYVKNSDAAIKPGITLRNVTLERKSSSYGDYTLVSKYELAA